MSDNLLKYKNIEPLSGMTVTMKNVYLAQSL